MKRLAKALSIPMKRTFETEYHRLELIATYRRQGRTEDRRLRAGLDVNRVRFIAARDAAAEWQF